MISNCTFDFLVLSHGFRSGNALGNVKGCENVCGLIQMLSVISNHTALYTGMGLNTVLLDIYINKIYFFCFIM